MFSDSRTITHACQSCGQAFESRSRTAYYCDRCKPKIKRAAAARSNAKRKERRRAAQAERSPSPAG